MEEKITLCGDDCLHCPRYNARTPEEQSRVAELWYRIGWRDHIVTNEEIACTGCSSHKQCTYGLVECTREHRVEKCSRCGRFPCGRIDGLLIRSAAYQQKCREVCTPEEYTALEKAFFNKENNLRKQ